MNVKLSIPKPWKKSLGTFERPIAKAIVPMLEKAWRARNWKRMQFKLRNIPHTNLAEVIAIIPVVGVPGFPEDLVKIMRKEEKEFIRTQKGAVK